MERFQYEILLWFKPSEQEEKHASSWYRGVGWYMNSRDESGKITSCNLIAPAQTGDAAGALEALNACGKEGWEVAIYVPEPRPTPPSLLGAVTNKFASWATGVEASPPNAYFILKRRSMS